MDKHITMAILTQMERNKWKCIFRVSSKKVSLRYGAVRISRLRCLPEYHVGSINVYDIHMSVTDIPRHVYAY